MPGRHACPKGHESIGHIVMSRRQRLTLLAAILASAVVMIDGSIVNVALPAIENDLGGGLSAQQWVSNAYLLALASLLLIGGSLGDIYGERRVFVVGLAAFGVMSVVCALAPTIEVLIGARALQGAAGALVTPSSLAIIVAAFGLFFFLVIYLQQVAGYSALESGLTIVPITVVSFALSRRFGALADRLGPRLFMGAGPLVAAAGILLLLRVGMHPSYAADLLPALLLFALGLSMTVAPLTATVLADADESDAGIASAVNNAVARVAGLLAVSLVGVVVATTLVGDTFAPNSESVRAFHPVVLICAALVATGGIAGSIGITNPSRPVEAERCPGGQLYGVPEPAVDHARRPAATRPAPTPQET
jgi:MFS family permease